MLSDISQTEKDKYCLISLICRITKEGREGGRKAEREGGREGGRKKRKKKTEIHRKRDQTCGY